MAEPGRSLLARSSLLARALLAAVPLLLAVGQHLAAGQQMAAQHLAAGQPPALGVLAVAPVNDGSLSLVATVQPPPDQPLARTAATVTVAGQVLATTIAPVLSEAAAVAVVVDTSSGGPLAGAGQGRAAASSFLQQLPPLARYAVVSDGPTPTVVASLAAGTASAVSAIGSLSTGGDRSTSEAISRALSQLPPWPLAQPVVVLYTSAPDAGGEAAPELAQRLLRAHALLAVVHTSAQTPYWSATTAATGGFTVSVGPAGPVGAFASAGEALRSRYVVTFHPTSGATTPGAPGQLAVTVGGTQAVAGLVLPGAAAGRVGSTPPAWIDQWAGWEAGLAAVGVTAILICLVALVTRHRQRPASATTGTVEPAPVAEERPSFFGVAPERAAGAGLGQTTATLLPQRIRDEQSATVEPETVGARADRARSHGRQLSATADADLAASRITAAEIGYASAINRFDALVRLAPGDPGGWRDLAATWVKLADLQLAADCQALAADSLRRCISAKEHAVALRPVDERARRDLAAAWSRLAALDAAAGRETLATLEYERSEALDAGSDVDVRR